MLADRMRMGGRRPAIQWLGSNWNANTSNTDYTISFSGVSAGANDLVLLVYGFGTATSGDHTFAVPSGYTKLLDLYQANTHSVHGCVAYRFLTGSAPASVTIPGCAVSSVTQVGVLMAFRNVNQTTPFDVTSTTASSAATIDIDPPAITPTTAGAWIVPVGVRAGKDDITFMGYNPPGDLNDPFGVAAGAGLGVTTPPATGVYGGTYRSWTSGSYNPGVWTADYSTSIGGYVAATMALRPA